MISTYFDELKETNYKNVAFELYNSMVAAGKSYDYHVGSIAVALALLNLQSENETECKTFSIEQLTYTGELKDIVNRHVNDLWDIVLKKLYRFTNNELKAFILFDNSCEFFKSGTCSTPSSVSNLICELLNIEDHESVFELCSGKGGFATHAFIHNQTIKYKGVELDPVAREIAVMRFSLLSGDADFILNDAFDYTEATPADKLFSNYPFMLRTPSLTYQKNKLANMFNIPGDVLQKASSDWLFNLKMISQMKDTGKAIAIMTNGSTWNAPDQRIRRFFVENGWIEAVISLPAKLFSDSAIATSLLIMSKGNDKIRLIDATNLCVKSKKVSEFTEGNIKQIIKAVNEDSNCSVTVDQRQLAENEYVLYATRYFAQETEYENGVVFESIVKNVTRGSQLKADELEELKANKSTPYQYIMLSNIDNGVVNLGNDQYLSEMPKKLEKYCIYDKSIVLSKIGSPTFKSAVICIDSDKKLLANGNLFVIEIDETKADPYYIQAYFSSTKGISAFKNIYSGASIATISLDKLKKMIIPLPELETQKEIGHKYMTFVNELMQLRKTMEEVTDKMQNLIE